MRTALLATAVAAASLAAVAAVAQTAGPDPFQWLEDIEAPRSLDWAKAQNLRTAAVLETDGRYETFRRQAFDIFSAPDRIPEPEFLGGGLANFWQDKSHPRGVWRRTTVDGYRAAQPAWETLLDLDALAKAEGKDWIWKGAECLPPDERRCLVRLSDGGKDAVELREFDTATKSFVLGGFRIPEGKSGVSRLDADTLLVARDWSGTGADLTRSNYPYIVKELKRGQPLPQAREVFRGERSDVRADGRVLREHGRVRAVLLERGLTFFTACRTGSTGRRTWWSSCSPPPPTERRCPTGWCGRGV